MLLIIGNEGCSRCEVVKNILKSKNIIFEYKLLNELENKQEYIGKARKKGMLSMPLIIKDDELVDLKEVI